MVKGNGPCNRERLATRVNAWEGGAWVREAAMAPAQKKQTERAATRDRDDNEAETARAETTE